MKCKVKIAFLWRESSATASESFWSEWDVDPFESIFYSRAFLHACRTSLHSTAYQRNPYTQHRYPKNVCWRWDWWTLRSWWLEMKHKGWFRNSSTGPLESGLFVDKQCVFFCYLALCRQVARPACGTVFDRGLWGSTLFSVLPEFCPRWSFLHYFTNLWIS